MNPSVKRLLGTVLLIATIGLSTVLAARLSVAQEMSGSIQATDQQVLQILGRSDHG